ncbi:MAG: GNAT family N-acetyltransferase [Alphaproteobacteria bacterium]|nr:GNAT family N-acetyltransferase [Alphaproteobacteria bacterium]
MSEIAVAAAGGADQAALTALLVQFFREKGFATPAAVMARNLAEMMADGSCWAALARADGAPIGAITVTTMLYVEWGRLGEIGDLYVLPPWRRRGVASRLIDAGMEWCWQRGCSADQVVVTEEGETRHGLSGFYRARGFTGTGRATLIAPRAGVTPSGRPRGDP